MAKMRVKDRDGVEHEIDGQLGVKLMETCANTTTA